MRYILVPDIYALGADRIGLSITADDAKRLTEWTFAETARESTAGTCLLGEPGAFKDLEVENVTLLGTKVVKDVWVIGMVDIGVLVKTAHGDDSDGAFRASRRSTPTLMPVWTT